jgi:hypothetical protein
MRGAGYKAWSVGSHSGPQGEWNESDLNVTNFRIPAVTHPRANNNTLRNRPAASIQFLDLAHHIKEHPSGHDALDLTRCVRYALQHPQETWIFPDDFERLVNQLGGPAQVTSYHCDAQVFRRADSTVVGSTIAGSVPITKKRKSSAMARTRAIGNTDSGATTPRKRATLDPDDLSTPPTSAVRRSGRLRTKPSDNAYKDDSDVDESEGKVNTPRSATRTMTSPHLEDSRSAKSPMTSPTMVTSKPTPLQATTLSPTISPTRTISQRSPKTMPIQRLANLAPPRKKPGSLSSRVLSRRPLSPRFLRSQSIPLSWKPLASLLPASRHS